MEAVILSREDINAIKEDLQEIKTYVKKMLSPLDFFIDNKTFVDLMGVSLRTAKNWRDEDKIGYTQEGTKVYYRLSDIKRFFEDNHHMPMSLKVKELLEMQMVV